MADDDECEFPEDWGVPDADDIEEPAVDIADEEQQDDCAVDEEEIDVQSEDDMEMSLGAAEQSEGHPDSADAVVAEELDANDADEGEIAVEDEEEMNPEGEAEADPAEEAETADEPGGNGEADAMVIEDDDDDDDLASAEAAALAALGGDEEESVELPSVPSRPHGKAPIVKAPHQRGSIVKAPIASRGTSGAKASIAKMPIVRPAGKNHSGPIVPTGRQQPVVRPCPPGAYQKPGVYNAAKGANGKGNHTGPIMPLAGGKHNASKGSKGAGRIAKASPPPALNSSSRQEKNIDSKDNKPKAAPRDAGIGHRVLALNKAGHWEKGRGISVVALDKLRGLPPSEAVKILDDLEAQVDSAPNPSKFIIVAAGGNLPARTASTGSTASPNAATKRPAPSGAAAGPPVKKIVSSGAVSLAAVDDDGDMEELLQKLTPAVRAKVTHMMTTIEIGASAIRSLVAAVPKDAMTLLQALLSRHQKGMKVANPTSWIVRSLQTRLGPSGGAAQPAPAAGTPGIAKAKPAIAKSTIVKAPAATNAKADLRSVGRPPVMRQFGGDDFEKLAVQEKLKSLNKNGPWKGQGAHPLDEAVLASLLKIDPGRALEILDETEAKGAELQKPSAFVLNKIKEDPS